MGNIDFANTYARNFVSTLQTAASNVYSDLTTVQSVTVTVPPSGKCSVFIGSGMGSSNSATYNSASFSASGANTFAASDDNGIYMRASASLSGAESYFSRTVMLTGLTPGSTTFTMKFKTTAGTGYFERREIWADVL